MALGNFKHDYCDQLLVELIQRKIELIANKKFF